MEPAAATGEAGPGSHKRYLLNNTYHGAWQDGGSWGRVKNHHKRIVVRDTTMDKSVDIWPGQTVIFYPTMTCARSANSAVATERGSKSRTTTTRTPAWSSRLCDAEMGTAGPAVLGPGRSVENIQIAGRSTMKVITR